MAIVNLHEASKRASVIVTIYHKINSPRVVMFATRQIIIYRFELVFAKMSIHVYQSCVCAINVFDYILIRFPTPVRRVVMNNKE